MNIIFQNVSKQSEHIVKFMSNICDIVQLLIGFSNRERAWQDKMLGWLYYIMSLPDFIALIKILFAAHLKHSTFCPSSHKMI